VLNVWKSDIYRITKSKLLYGTIAISSIIALFLMAIIRNDIHLGISIGNNLTVFKNVNDIVYMGVSYQKALGILVAIIISGFIGEEYHWKTWKHKWIASNSRMYIYLSKVLLSLGLSITIFLVYEIVAILCSGQIATMFTGKYLSVISCGIMIYGALGSVICLFSMLIKNSTISTVVCLCYVVLSETAISLLGAVGNLSKTGEIIGGWLIRKSIYGMTSAICSKPISTDILVATLVNTTAIILLSTITGVYLFKKYEL
jgi:ABC-type transport system involved in multi-copper enzyme maturation permease subunit